MKHDSFFSPRLSVSGAGMIQSSGFTLIELLVVIAVIGILAGFVVVNFGDTLNEADIAKAKIFSKSIENDRGSQAGWWRFEEQTGTLAKDSSSFSNDGTLSSSGMWQDEDQCGLGFGGCLQFDESALDRIDTPLVIDSQTSSATFSVWFNVYDLSIQRAIIEQGSTEDVGRDILTVTSDAELSTFFAEGAYLRSQQGSVKLNAWTHAALTWNLSENERVLYLNGEEVARDNVTTLESSTDTIIFGLQRDGVNSPFDGLIDEISIHTQALIASQIKQIYAQGVVKRAITYK